MDNGLLNRLRSAAAFYGFLALYHATFKEAADTIERLQKENDRLRRPRCLDEPAGDPCKFCGAREATDVCRDGTAHIIRERDAALAEVERLKGLLSDRRFAQEQATREAKQNAYDRSQGFYGDGMTLGREGE